MVSPGRPGLSGTKIFYTIADNKSKEEIGASYQRKEDVIRSIYFFFIRLLELELVEVRELDDLDGEERETRELDVLLNEREEEELLDGEMRLGDEDLEREGEERTVDLDGEE
jgi:hypothetical protein